MLSIKVADISILENGAECGSSLVESACLLVGSHLNDTPFSTELLRLVEAVSKELAPLAKSPRCCKLLDKLSWNQQLLWPHCWIAECQIYWTQTIRVTRTVSWWRFIYFTNSFEPLGMTRSMYWSRRAIEDDISGGDELNCRVRTGVDSKALKLPLKLQQKTRWLFPPKHQSVLISFLGRGIDFKMAAFPD